MRSILEAKNIEEESFFRQDIIGTLDLLSFKFMDPYYEDIANQLSIKTGWPRSPVLLLHRVVRLANHQEFSFRENMLIKRLVPTKTIYEDVNFDEIASFFPGKFMSSVKAKIRTLLNRSRQQDI